MIKITPAIPSDLHARFGPDEDFAVGDIVTVATGDGDKLATITTVDYEPHRIVVFEIN